MILEVETIASVVSEDEIGIDTLNCGSEFKTILKLVLVPASFVFPVGGVTVIPKVSSSVFERVKSFGFTLL